MAKNKCWRYFLISILFFACSIFSQDVVQKPETVSNDSSLIPEQIAAPAKEISLDVDKWSLWTNGTQLRGANTWQRIVIPKLDGEDFLGDGYIGPPYTEEDFKQLSSLGANYVNLSHPGIFSEQPPFSLDERALVNLDEMIRMASKADLFIVISFRTGPGRNDFTFYRDDDWFSSKDLMEFVWEDSEAQAAWVNMWRYTAERYRNNSYIVGYDLMCEPNSNEILNEWDPNLFETNYGGSLYDWNFWYPVIAEEIREVDKETPILVGGNGYSSLEWLPFLEIIEADRIVYTFHQYAPVIYTHQEPGREYNYPDQLDTNYDGLPESFDQEWLKNYLAAAGDFMDENDVVLAVNEFGAVRWGVGAADFYQDEFEIFEELGLNHALWVWDPAWMPWVEEVNALNFRLGPDPNNSIDIENELMDVVKNFWSLNTVRPSDFLINGIGD